VHEHGVAEPTAVEVERIVALLASKRVALWVGFGARRHGEAIHALVERTGMPVMCTPRGLGLADRCASFIGVTGNGGHEFVAAELARFRPEYVLVLGTRLGEASSGWACSLVPSEAFIQVDHDRRAIGRGYPEVSTLGVEADIGATLAALLEADLPRQSFTRLRAPRVRLARGQRPGVVHPVALMEALQRVVLDGSDVPVLGDAASAMFFAAHHLEFATGDRWVTEQRWGSMGTAGTAVVGVAAARDDAALALCGDGAMHMFDEINTAVHYGIPAIWCVLNDDGLGVVRHGMEANDRLDHDAWYPPTDFAAVAIAKGAQALRVTREQDLDAALRTALEAGGPFLLDIAVDPEVAPPIGDRAKR
jgi:acetolactate synthase-1/2/3 large subunit